ncbi:MAG: hypothetical protein JNN20_10875 [Betaproteobacteria bacterium]|nr:hypothetical protein [Betaproteobacteria bacterium]
MDLIKGQAAAVETAANVEFAEPQAGLLNDKKLLTLTDWEMAMAGGGESTPCWG